MIVILAVLFILSNTLSVSADDYRASDDYSDAPFYIIAEDAPQLASEDGEEVVTYAGGNYTVYPQYSSNGQTYLKAVLENYPYSDYLYARTGEYQYTLWVNGSYSLDNGSVTVSGAKRYVFSYNYSGSSSNRYTTISVTDNVDDVLSYTSYSYANIYGSLQGLPALRGDANNNGISWSMLALCTVCMLMLPVHAYIGNRAAQRRR